MAYTHTTRADFRSQLAARLGEASTTVHWIEAELNLIINDTLQRWQLMTGQQRDRGVMPTTASTGLYSLPSVSALSSLIGYSTTDRGLLGLMMYMLVEPSDPIDGTGMSDQFTFANLVSAVQRARNQLISDSSAILSLTTLVVAPPNFPDPSFPDSLFHIRRAVWKGQDGSYSNLHRLDEHEAAAYNAIYTLDPGVPDGYSVIASPSLRLRLVPPPIDTGTIDVVAALSGVALDPATPVVLGVPDDATWVVRARALSDLLLRDGPAYDPARAAYCEADYQMGVSLLKANSLVLAVEVDGVPAIPSSIADIDLGYGSPHWQGLATGAPADVGILANIMALRPVPDGAPHSVTLDLVTKATLPTADVGEGSYLQISRDDVGAVLDGAEALAYFKLGGGALDDATRLMRQMITSAARYNSRISVGGYGQSMARLSTADEQVRPAAGAGTGTGSVSPAAAANSLNSPNSSRERERG